MGQCVVKDCGFNVQKLNEPQRKNLNEFLKEVFFLNYYLI